MGSTYYTLALGGGETKKKHEQPIKTDGVRIRPCVLT